jgi:hypothetical protein
MRHKALVVDIDVEAMGTVKLKCEQISRNPCEIKWGFAYNSATSFINS